MPEYSDSVFVNCPFDNEYIPILRAIIFTIYRCGFFPVTALAEDDGLDNRLSKIERLIERCKYGVHDISRTELNANGLPRFNMPFELGVFFGAKRFGDRIQKNKVAIILDRDRFRYMQFISDLNGVDIRTHDGNYANAIQRIRDWLRTSSRRITIPGHLIIIGEYDEFSRNLPAVVERLGLDMNTIPFNDFCLIVEEAIQAML